MIIIGAGGHAKEILGILAESDQDKELFFYDNISIDQPDLIFKKFPILKKEQAARQALEKDPRFILGIGKPALRKEMAQAFRGFGGSLFSVISPFARIGRYGVSLGEGLNIMTGAILTQDIVIGTGTLVHVNVTIHHDCRIGSFCELSPGCHLLGKVKIGDLVSIGSGAVVLPGLTIGNGSVIGAGAVVTTDIPEGVTVKGIPAKI
jgi:sugar O-acyltransferase (sialic acid O-acetyltransferase NeuD family)